MNLSRTISTILLFAVLLAGLAVGLSAVQSHMNALRIEHRLTDTEPLENAPPLVAFTTVALGGFRGLVADWLWLRSERMQQAGNYFEMVQLASWIVKLQPRFTAATAFLAWNMSYNISVTFSSFEDRWRWVRRGIELIRDEAMKYNPGDPELFHQLGWIYQHKLGKDLDDANRYYKTQMAKEMIKVLGGYAGKWELLRDAPTTEGKLRALIGRDSPFWRLLARHGMTFEEFEKDFRERGGFSPADRKELEKDGILQPVELCLRARWLRNKYRLDPERIIKINKKYGKLDWRLPEAHAIYWATRGKEVWDKDEDNFKRLSCDRMIFQALNAAFQGGRLVYLRDIEHLEMTPNISLVDAVDKSYREAMKRYDKDGSHTIRGAYQNFLVDATVTLYKFGQKKKAAEYFKKARKEFPSRFTGKLDEFVLKELAEDMALASYNQAQGTIQSYLLQWCYWLALDDTDQAVAYERIAYKLYLKYQNSIGDTKERRGLPDYKQMKESAIVMARDYFPKELFPRLLAALPASLRQRVNDLLKSRRAVLAPVPRPAGSAPSPGAKAAH